MGLPGFRSSALRVQRVGGAKGGFSQSSGRGLMAAEGEEEVNLDGSGKAYVPCIWKDVSIYLPTRPSVRSKVGTLYIG